MKKLVLASALSLLICMSVSAGQGVYGTWLLPPMQQGALSFNVSITIEDGSLTMTNVCALNGQSSQAQVKVPSTMAGNFITVLQPGNDHQTRNGVECSINIAPSSMSYSLSPDEMNLTLTMAGQPALVLHRK